MKQVYDSNGTLINLLQDSDIESQSNYVKLPDGTLICYGRLYIEANNEHGVFYFPVSFVEPPVVSFCYLWANGQWGYITTDGALLDHVNIYSKSTDYGITKGRSINVIAIGRWK